MSAVELAPAAEVASDGAVKDQEDLHHRLQRRTGADLGKHDHRLDRGRNGHGSIDFSSRFWGFGALVKDAKRLPGKNLMQRMLSVMQRPGISHRKLSKMNFMGMGPWMMFQLAKQYNVSKPKDLLGMCQELGVKIYPCQMTMDLFGLNKEDLIDGLEEPVGAATMLMLATEADSTLFI